MREIREVGTCKDSSSLPHAPGEVTSPALGLGQLEQTISHRVEQASQLLGPGKGCKLMQFILTELRQGQDSGAAKCEHCYCNHRQNESTNYCNTITLTGADATGRETPNSQNPSDL